MLRQEIQRPDDSTTDAQLAAELQALLQPLTRGVVVATRRRDSTKHAQGQDRSPSRSSGLQRDEASIIQRFGVRNITLLKQHLCHQREIHRLAHTMS